MPAALNRCPAAGKAPNKARHLADCKPQYCIMLQCRACLTIHSLTAAASRLTRPYDTTKEEYELTYFPFPVYKDPEMHQTLVGIALAGARAFQESDRSDRMSQHVLLRIDVALTTHNDKVSMSLLPGLGNMAAADKACY